MILGGSGVGSIQMCIHGGINSLDMGLVWSFSHPLEMGGFWRSRAAHPHQNLVEYPRDGRPEDTTRGPASRQICHVTPVTREVHGYVPYPKGVIEGHPGHCCPTWEALGLCCRTLFQAVLSPDVSFRIPLPYCMAVKFGCFYANTKETKSIPIFQHCQKVNIT